MDSSLVLSKCITLLYRESQIENLVESSADLIKTVVDKIKTNDATIGGNGQKNIVVGLKALVYEMCSKQLGSAPKTYDQIEFLQQVKIITNGDDNLYQAIAQGIEPELQPTILKRTVTNIRKTISNQFREQKIDEIVAKAYKDLSFNRHKINDLSGYINNVITELGIASNKASAKDSSIVRSMNFGDDESMKAVFDNVADSNSGDLPFKLGWRELNEALQGGPRPGDCMVTGALEHSYKTGSSLSMFAHIPLYNKPKNKDPNKKPLCYRVSLEDPLKNNAQFLYLLLKYDETRQFVDVKGVSVDEMWRYVKERLCVNGYHVLIDEVNPLTWTYQSLINRIIELESEGYVVEVLSVDYLAKIPTTGCVQGSTGDDMLDMFSKIRAFCLANGILFQTPHQLSTEAKRLTQIHPGEQFLNAIKGGGFFEKTKGLPRIYDIGMLIHKIETEGGDYLHFVIDKHRFPTVVESNLKSFFLAFPKCKMPIPSNINDENYKVLRKLPKVMSSSADSFFSFS